MAFDENSARIRTAPARKKGIAERCSAVGFCSGNLLVGVWRTLIVGSARTTEKMHKDRTSRCSTSRATDEEVVEPEGVEDDDSLKDWIQRAVKFVGKLPKKEER